MSFVEYQDITNHYQKKTIDHMVEHYPEFLNVKFSIQEKIDGTNFRIMMNPDGKYLLGSRHRVLSKEESHFDIRKVLYEKYSPILMWLKNKSKQINETIILFGELYGKGINKRINYGDVKRIVFFDVMIGGVMQTPKEFYKFIGQSRMGIKQIYIAKNLEEALNFNIEIESFYSPTKDQMEGIVIKPFDRVYYDGHEKPFYLKKKNKKFLETKTRKKGKKQIQSSPLEPFITKNRMISVFSKEGYIKDKKDIGKYIKLIRDDAIMDYNKENNNELTSDEIKFVSKKIYHLLMKEL